ncbi:MAG: DUF1015 domain-containing protein [Rhodospirillaceae bacterium]|jgi:uncharacterized protein (DUF1015 family)|nr:DUF1015 domain-containing protein [Rhodospirillaceae bacterium]MBT3930108.1 DUF1015 domain-containing protein [Rhodospirillaceae bacterium]MBT5358517.1 DUF1015 domain-containing protein [Rhodospirillaceae bacterium]MBT5767779.1 DUF1015 domain-containing protein [Rhodospirillaceae bacterium]MBT6310776.1 DUF1015 domain-containing protein [Rhodospirillaceae bacterium]
MSEHLLHPFPGLRPAPGAAADVAAPPYDVVSFDEAAAMADGRPWSFLHVSRPEIDLPPGTDSHADEVYAKGASNLAAMIEAGVLIRDEAPSYYVYRIIMGDHSQTGLVAATPVDAYLKNIVRKHEFTRPDKEDDRVRQIDEVDAQTGPVLVVHQPQPAISAILKEVTAKDPTYDVTQPDGVRHIVWAVTVPADVQRVADAYAPVDVLYIADGHHRSAAAARVAALREGRDGVTDAHERFLIVAFPTDELHILDYNRVIKDLNGLSEEAFLARVNEAFDVTPASAPARPARQHEFGMYIGGAWYALLIKSAPGSDAPPLDRLDVKLLSDRLLEPVLGIADPRTDPRIDFVGGIRGLEALEARVDSGDWAVAFALYATSIGDLMAVADANEVMPPKSTWFEPKLADGLVSYPLDV